MDAPVTQSHPFALLTPAASAAPVLRLAVQLLSARSCMFALSTHSCPPSRSALPRIVVLRLPSRWSRAPHDCRFLGHPHNRRSLDTRTSAQKISRPFYSYLHVIVIIPVRKPASYLFAIVAHRNCTLRTVDPFLFIRSFPVRLFVCLDPERSVLFASAFPFRCSYLFRPGCDRGMLDALDLQFSIQHTLPQRTPQTHSRSLMPDRHRSLRHTVSPSLWAPSIRSLSIYPGGVGSRLPPCTFPLYLFGTSAPDEPPRARLDVCAPPLSVFPFCCSLIIAPVYPLDDAHIRTPHSALYNTIASIPSSSDTIRAVPRIHRANAPLYHPHSTPWQIFHHTSHSHTAHTAILHNRSYIAHHLTGTLPCIAILLVVFTVLGLPSVYSRPRRPRGLTI